MSTAGTAAALSWEPQAGESAKAYDAFRIYAQLPAPERSIDKAWEGYAGVSLAKGARAPGYFARWSREHGWTRRAAAWDAERARRLREAEAEVEREAIKDMRKRHVTLAMSLQAIASEDLARIRAKQGRTRSTDPNKPADPVLSAYQLARLLRDGIAVERLARGEPETITEERAEPVDPTAPSEDETRALLLRILGDPDTLALAQQLAIALDQ